MTSRKNRPAGLSLEDTFAWFGATRTESGCDEWAGAVNHWMRPRLRCANDKNYSHTATPRSLNRKQEYPHERTSKDRIES